MCCLIIRTANHALALPVSWNEVTTKLGLCLGPSRTPSEKLTTHWRSIAKLSHV